eukprot:jgi/Phyca11/509923/fgenesh2_kg.PHYCAscaffold_51_\
MLAVTFFCCGLAVATEATVGVAVGILDTGLRLTALFGDFAFACFLALFSLKPSQNGIEQ